MPLVFDTLIRFRLHAIAIAVNIEKAFLQIEIKEVDRTKNTDFIKDKWEGN